MDAARVRLGLGFVFAILFVGMLQTQWFSESLLLFAAAGVVPGTHIVLSPNATLGIVAGILGVTMLILLRGLLWRLVRPGHDIDTVSLDETSTSEVMPEPATTLITVELQSNESTQSTRPVFWLPIIHRITALAAAAGRYGRAVYAMLHARLLLLKDPTIRITQHATQLTARYARLAHIEGARLIRQAIACIQRVDHWVTARMLTHENVAALHTLLREAVKVLSAWTAKARSYVLRFLA